MAVLLETCSCAAIFLKGVREFSVRIFAIFLSTSSISNGA